MVYINQFVPEEKLHFTHRFADFVPCSGDVGSVRLHDFIQAGRALIYFTPYHSTRERPCHGHLTHKDQAGPEVCHITSHVDAECWGLGGRKCADDNLFAEPRRIGVPGGALEYCVPEDLLGSVRFRGIDELECDQVVRSPQQDFGRWMRPRAMPFEHPCKLVHLRHGESIECVLFLVHNVVQRVLLEYGTV